MNHWETLNLGCDCDLPGKLCVWDCGPSAGREGLWEDSHPHSARVLWTRRHKWSSGKSHDVMLETSLWNVLKDSNNHIKTQTRTRLTSVSVSPGDARGAEPGAHAERGALAGCVAGPGGQSQPPGAHLQAAGRLVRTRSVPQRHGKLLRQTAQGAARPGAGHAWSPTGEWRYACSLSEQLIRRGCGAED